MKGARGRGGIVLKASWISAVAMAVGAAGLGTSCVGTLGFDPNASSTGGSSGARQPTSTGGTAGPAGTGGSAVAGGWTGGAGAAATAGTGGSAATGGAVNPGGTSATGGSSYSGGASGTGGSLGRAGTGGAPSSSGGRGGVSAVAAGSGGAGSGGSTATASACPSGFNVLETIFTNKCGGCHGAASPTKNLDMVSPGLAARMVNKASSCRNLPFLSITPNAKGGPAGYLLDKLAGPVTGCGVQMPAGAAALTLTEIACVNDWAVAAIAREGTAR